MRLMLESMKVERSITSDGKEILVNVSFSVKLPPQQASGLARILSTNVLEVIDVEHSDDVIKIEKS